MRRALLTPTQLPSSELSGLMKELWQLLVKMVKSRPGPAVACFAQPLLVAVNLSTACAGPLKATQFSTVKISSFILYPLYQVRSIFHGRLTMALFWLLTGHLQTV